MTGLAPTVVIPERRDCVIRGSKCRPSVFRITDHRVGSAAGVSLAPQRPAAHADGRRVCVNGKTRNETALQLQALRGVRAGLVRRRRRSEPLEGRLHHTMPFNLGTVFANLQSYRPMRTVAIIESFNIVIYNSPDRNLQCSNVIQRIICWLGQVWRRPIGRNTQCSAVWIRDPAGGSERFRQNADPSWTILDY